MTRGWADGRDDYGSPSHSRLITMQFRRTAPRIALSGSPSRQPYGRISATGPRMAMAKRLTIMAYAERPSRFARGNGCVLWLTLP